MCSIMVKWVCSFNVKRLGVKKQSEIKHYLLKYLYKLESSPFTYNGNNKITGVDLWIRQLLSTFWPKYIVYKSNAPCRSWLKLREVGQERVIASRFAPRALSICSQKNLNTNSILSQAISGTVSIAGARIWPISHWRA